MGDITGLLSRWANGDAEAFGALMPVVYDELRKLADHYLSRERSDHTLQPTALVHEAYLRLSGIRNMELRNRAHFYGAAAQVMRRVLVDHARQRRALKRGGPSAVSVPFDEAIDTPIERASICWRSTKPSRGSSRSRRPARASSSFATSEGCRSRKRAEYLGVAPATVKRHWAFARAWLFSRLRP